MLPGKKTTPERGAFLGWDASQGVGLFVDGHHGHTVPVVGVEERAYALTLCADTVGCNTIFINKRFLYGFGTALSQLLVECERAILRGVALDVAGGLLVVLESVGGHSDVGLLVGLDVGGTAVEEHIADVVEVLHHLLHYGSLTAAGIELSLEVGQLSQQSGIVYAASLKVGAQSVDLSIQIVDLGLVVGLNEGEVVGAVVVLEVICNTGLELEIHIVHIVVRIISQVGEHIL